MFFLMNFIEEITLSPSDLNNDLRTVLARKLIKKKQATCSKKYGYIIRIMNIDKNIPNGYIMNTSGDITFKVKFTAVVMKPFNGEICEGIVDQCSEYSVNINVGPLKFMISREHLPIEYKFYENTKEYRSQNAVIKEGGGIRFRIYSLYFEEKEKKLLGLGTIKDNYLGPI